MNVIESVSDNKLIFSCSIAMATARCGGSSFGSNACKQHIVKHH